MPRDPCGDCGGEANAEGGFCQGCDTHYCDVCFKDNLIDGSEENGYLAESCLLCTLDISKRKFNDAEFIKWLFDKSTGKLILREGTKDELMKQFMKEWIDSQRPVCEDCKAEHPTAPFPQKWAFCYGCRKQWCDNCWVHEPSLNCYSCEDHTSKTKRQKLNVSK